MKRRKKREAGRIPSSKPVNKGLEKAIDIFGGVTNLALELEVHHSSVCIWRYNSKKKIPIKYVLKIVKLAEGEIKPHDLRPDVYIIDKD